MSYISPQDLLKKMIDAEESKVKLSTQQTLFHHHDPKHGICDSPHGLGRHAGADDVEAIEPGLGRDRLVAAALGQAVFADGQFEGLGHLAPLGDGSDRQADLVLAGQGAALALGRHDDAREVALGGGQHPGACGRAPWPAPCRGEHIPEKRGRFSDQDRLTSKGIEPFR